MIGTAYALGTYLFNIQSANKSRASFYNLSLGVLLIIALYSIICTGFKTVNLCSLVFLAILAVNNYKHPNVVDLKFHCLTPFLYILPVTVILFSAYTFGENVNEDLKYYSKISYTLRELGQENFYHFYNIYDSKFNGMIPYHYTELWLASFFNFTTKSLAIFSLKNFSYPFLVSITSFGILSLTEKNKILIFLVLTGLSVVSLGNYIGIDSKNGWTIYTDFWMRPNLITYYFLLTLCFFALLDNNYKLFYIFISIGLTFSVVIMPALLASIVIFEIFNVCLKKRTYKESFQLLSFPFLSAILIALLYTIFASSANVSTTFKIKELIQSDLQNWKAIVYASVVLIAELSLLPILFWLINRYYIKIKALQIFTSFTIILAVCGVLLFQLLNKIDNAYQLAYFGYAAVGFLSICFFIILISKFNSVIIPALAAIICACFGFSVNSEKFQFDVFGNSLSGAYLMRENVSATWIKEFKSYKNMFPNAKGGFVYSSLDRPSNPKLRQDLTRQLGSYISYLTDDCNLPSLTCTDSLLTDLNAQNVNQFEKCKTWVALFPKYTNECNAEKYLQAGLFDFFICNQTTRVTDPSLRSIHDPLNQLKLVHN